MRLIAELKEVESGFKEAGHRDMAAAVYVSRKKAESLLPYEREVIENSHQNGFYCGTDVATSNKPEFNSAQQYFNQTFPTNE